MGSTTRLGLLPAFRRRGATRAVCFFGLCHCTIAAVDSAVEDPSEAAPSITTASVTCAPDSGKWQVDISTERWTGGGGLWMSTDGNYVEKSEVLSVEAEGDGSADRLELKLTFVADFTDVSAGSTTAFNCGTPNLQGLVVVYERDGKTQADCRVFGDDGSRWEAWGIGRCVDTVVVEEPA